MYRNRLKRKIPTTRERMIPILMTYLPPMKRDLVQRTGKTEEME
jgi:hypothetical protein